MSGTSHGRPKGTPKTGGRKKGTPNVATKNIKETFQKLLRDYENSGLMASDFAAVEPKDRLYLMEKIANYVAPKMQAVALSGDEQKPLTIEQKLKELAASNE